MTHHANHNHNHHKGKQSRPSNSGSVNRHQHDQPQTQPQQPLDPSSCDDSYYQVSLSPKFVGWAFVVTSAVCFALGRVARHSLVVEHHQLQAALEQLEQQQHQYDYYTSSMIGQQLPPLFVAPHKTKPSTRYTSKHYDTGLSIGSDTLLSSYQPQSQQQHQQQQRQSPHKPVESEIIDSTNKTDSTHHEQEEEEIHEPAGQHLLIDIEHVDGAFLNSEHHLAQAMIDLVDKSGLTMLSYHCHKLLPAGVSCAGVLLESHVSFHTWPVQGVITLDLFTCGPNSLLNLLDDVQQLFAIPDYSDSDSTTQPSKKPNMIWAFKRRGFPTDEGYTPGISNLGTTLLGVLQFPAKEQLAFFQTPFQQVHIYDVLDPRYSTTQMDRRMYLDGVLQSRQRGQTAFAESLVHPALLAHPNPRRVTIVGGGEGASLREVLKHTSVERVEWMEIDQQVAEISLKWLWSKCDDLILPNSNGATESCRDDPRVNLYYEDGLEWFQERFGLSTTTTLNRTERQDVILMDVLNPEDEVDFSEVLYDDLDFARLLYNALSEDGILTVKVGTGNSLEDPPEYLTRSHHVATLVDNLEQVGFATIREYEDSHGGILESVTSSFIVAFKNELVSSSEWFANEALVQVKLHERLVRTKSGKPPLSYFDGATMQSFWLPSRATEVVYCRNRRAPHCEHGLDSSIPNFPITTALELLKDGTSRVAVRDIPQGSFVAMEACVQQLHLHDAAKDLLQNYLGGDHELLFRDAHSARLTTNSPGDAYNPFRDRNFFTHHCVAQSLVKSDIKAGELVGTPSVVLSSTDNKRAVCEDLPPAPPRLEMTLDEPSRSQTAPIPTLGKMRLNDVVYNSGVDHGITSQDNHRPNFTTVASSDACRRENKDTHLEAAQCSSAAMPLTTQEMVSS